MIERLLIKKHRKRLWTPFIKAVKDFNLIRDNDRIAICISGGKDSFILAKLFEHLYKYGKRNFELEYISIDPGYSKKNLDKMLYNAEILGIDLKVYKKNIFDILVNNKKPCYLCSKVRRGSLYTIAKELGCNKIALAHHYDDVIETILLNVLSGGQYMTMMPKLKSKNFSNLELIRPLYYVREKDIIKIVKDSELSFLDCACEVASKKIESNRLKIKHLIKELKKDFYNVEHSIFASAKNVHIEAILGYKKEEKKISFLDNY